MNAASEKRMRECRYWLGRALEYERRRELDLADMAAEIAAGKLETALAIVDREVAV